MKLEATIEGKTVLVEVESSGTELRSRVDGRLLDTQADWLTQRELALRVDGRSYDLMVYERGAGVLEVWIGGRTVVVRFEGEERTWAASRASGKARADVLAPMPGKVVAVLVEVGDVVTQGQGVVVVEAMKMENEIAAPGPGIVKAIAVRPGQIVEGGATLIVIAPEMESAG